MPYPDSSAASQTHLHGKQRTEKTIAFNPASETVTPPEFRHGRLWKDDRIEVPRSKLRETMEFHHSNTTHGHWGLRKTYDLIARKFVFKNMKSLISEFIKTCPECQRSKADRRGQQGQLQPLPLHKRKWQSIAMDWVFGLPHIWRKSTA